MSIVEIVRTWRQRLAFWRYQRRIARALALNRRGEVRQDGLRIVNCKSRLDIQWEARQIHPWDRALPGDTTDSLVIEQSLADTEAAISRLFTAVPEIDTIAFEVLGPGSSHSIIVGTVDRSDLKSASGFASVKMRLKELGVDYRLTQSRFIPLDSNDQVGFSLR